MKEKRPAGVIVVRAHGGGGAATTHGIVVVGIGFCCGKSGFGLHELWTRNVIFVVAAAIAAAISAVTKHDVLFSLFISLSFKMFVRYSFTDSDTKDSATTGK